jgi:hypothetical protein
MRLYFALLEVEFAGYSSETKWWRFASQLLRKRVPEDALEEALEDALEEALEEAREEAREEAGRGTGRGLYTNIYRGRGLQGRGNGYSTYMQLFRNLHLHVWTFPEPVDSHNHERIVVSIAYRNVCWSPLSEPADIGAVDISDPFCGHTSSSPPGGDVRMNLCTATIYGGFGRGGAFM